MTAEKFINYLVSNSIALIMYEVHKQAMEERKLATMELPVFLEFWQKSYRMRQVYKSRNNFDLDEMVAFYVNKLMADYNIIKVKTKDKVFLFHSHIIA